MDNNILKNKEKFLKLLKEELENPGNVCLVESNLKYEHNIKLFSSLCIMSIKRVVEGKERTFVAIKNIELLEEAKSQGIFREILDIMESSHRNVMVDDIINHQLFSFLTKRNYKNMKYNQYGGWIRSMYKLKN